MSDPAADSRALTYDPAADSRALTYDPTADSRAHSDEPAAHSRALVAVLAGGAGRRMGAAKATVELEGRPLVCFPIEAARGAGLEAVLLAKPTTPLPELDTEVWIEPAAPRHPLVGLVTALERAGGRAVLALGCDLPLASPELLRWLAGVEPHEAAVVPVVGGRPQPLLARYSSRALDPLREALTSEMALTAAVASLHPRWVGEAELRRFGDPARMALNVNSPADLERAAALLARRA